MRGRTFKVFDGYLRFQGLWALDGQIIIVTFIPVPRQRITCEENKENTAGRVAQG